ncbi:amino acid adenylation domain-containing protein [Kitasatospora sp. NPDC085879]|uniref:amino acid adenylation domain-containing protein n=1 Tax=Kitasatospora sp. NPDC085879 TaxID=3154769 RepID=UPI00341E6CCB
MTTAPADRGGPPDSGAGTPLSYAQQRVWFLDQLTPGTVDYVLPYALRLAGVLDLPALRRALADLFAVHAALRTRYPVLDDGQPVQVVDDRAELRLDVLDLRELPETEREPRAEREIDAIFARPFDLAADLPVRAALLRLRDDEQILVMTIHHISWDRWSEERFFGALDSVYGAHREGRPAELPAPRTTYADYAAGQRARVESGELDGQLAYWRAALADLTPTEFPADRPRPARRDAGGAAVRIAVPEETGHRLMATARACRATPYAVLLAALSVVLARYTGQDDVSVATAVAGRRDPELEELVGFFVNTAVIRTRPGPRQTFRELVGAVRNSAFEAIANEDLPFDLLVERLRPERDLARNPLAQVQFLYEGVSSAETRLGDLAMSTVRRPLTSVKFDLTVKVQRQQDGGFEAVFEYATALYDHATVERLAHRYLAALDRLTGDRELPLDRFELLTADERTAALAAGRGPKTDHGPALLPALVSAAAATHPAATAVIGTDGRELTYAELEARANRLARHLIALGVAPGEPVAVLLDRDGAHGADLVAALLAVWRAGGVYLPLDPAQPAARTAAVLADSAARIVLTRSDLLPALPADPDRTPVSLDRAALPDLPATAPETAPAGDDVAYLIYTSGSTGRPKGVLVTHAGIRNRVLWTVRRHGIGPADRVLQKTTATFDASVWELVAPLVAGGTVVLAPAAAQADPAGLLRTAAAHRVTILQFVPSVLRDIAEQPNLADCDALRLVLSAGEPLPAELARQVEKRTGAEVFNTYGPTECAIDATAHRYRAAEDTGPVVPIGRPLDNAEAHVLDGDGRPAPDGAPGELHLGGAGLARGYLGRPDLTADRFVPDPFAASPGGRLYRTGDLVRRRADGTLEFLGRLDHQVKIRGVRVEPGEVEAALADCPGVAAAAVVAWPDPESGARLVGYVVPTEPSATDPALLRDRLAQRLPKQYVPSLIGLVDSLPRTSTGKLDRRALPDPLALALAQQGHTETAPATPAEATVAALWAELLGLPAIGVHDDFFALGGHSLMATRAATRTREALGVELPLAWIFESPTVAALCARLGEAAPAAPAEPLRPAGRPGPLPLSAAQERLWLHDQLHPGSADYLVPIAWRLTGRLDPDALTGALRALTARHEILRTRYLDTPDGPRQLADPAGDPAPELLDLTGLPADRREEAARAALAERARRGFDLTAEHPLRATLARLADGDHVLLLTLHHIACDGQSLGLIGTELDRAYTALTGGGTADSVAPALQYADWAQWHRDRVDRGLGAEQARRWAQTLAGVPALELPTDRPRPAVRDGAGADHVFALPAGTSEALAAYGRSRGATPFMSLLAGYLAFLHRYTGQDDFAVGTPVAGRDAEQTHTMLGSFVNTLAMRADLSAAPTFAELLDRVRAGALSAFADQDCPFDRVVAELRPERDPSRTPVFQTMFQTFEGAEPSLALGPLGVRPFRVADAPALTDLSLVLRARQGGGWQGEFEYATALFDAATVERMADHLVRLLDALAAAPDRPITEHPLLTAEEAVGQGDFGRGRTDRRPMHEVVAAQTRATPDAPAVISPDAELTYARLDAEAERLAARLRALGIRPGAVVASAMPRDHRLVVAWLGILKAGGCYLPVDPADPAERLAGLLAESRASAVVTVAATRSALPAAGIPVLHFDEPGPPADTRPVGEPVSPRDLAYLIYTSGSTGRPKGVMVEHRSYVEHCHVMAQAYRLGPGERFALMAAVSFDASMDQIAAPLTAGGAVVVLDPRAVSPDELLDQIERLRVTVLDVTPVYYRELLERLRPGDRRLEGLALMSVGGDVVTALDARRWARTGLPGAFACTYGPTEATVACTMHTAGADSDGRQDAAALPIGRPLVGTVARVLDGRQQPVPPGVVGELMIGGSRVARGYLGRPDLTADRFVPDPFATEPGARLYRTGDLVRARADGVIEFVGRADRQVKIRGYRIEPGEIEAVLAAHPDVAGAAVEPCELRAGDRALAAYVVLRDRGSDDRGALDRVREDLRAALPAHLVPAVFVPLAALPVTRNGKLDRKALPAPDLDRIQADRPHTPPRDALEERLCELWQQVLGVDRIGVEDDFFLDLGGHSLLVTRLRLLVEDAFGITLTLRQFFEHTTAAAHARLVREAVEAAVEALSDEELETLLAQEEGLL